MSEQDGRAGGARSGAAGGAGAAAGWLSAEEARAWLGYRRMHALLDLQISRDLARDSGLSEADYDVLSTLSESPEQMLRLGDLAAHMLWSKSRLSHHITRMQQRDADAEQHQPAVQPHQPLRARPRQHAAGQPGQQRPGLPGDAG